MLTLALGLAVLAAQATGGERVDAQAPVDPLASLAFTRAPSGLAFRMVDVPDATHAAIVAAVRVGAWHDPPGRTGMAHVVSVVLSLREEGKPEAERWTATAAGPATYLALTCPRAEVKARTAELLRLLQGGFTLTEDLFARARAIAVLRADDYQELVPGPRVIEMARRLTAADTPEGKQFFGVPSEMQAITRGELEAWIAARFRPAHTSLVVLGAVDGTGVRELPADPSLVDGRAPTQDAVPTVHDTAPAIATELEHAQLRAPFVSVVIKAPPPGPELLPFLVAMGVVQARCYAVFGAYRGREHEAGLPFFWFNYRRGDGFAVISRRGVDDAPPDAVRAEVNVLLRRLRTQAPTLQEVGMATGQIAGSLMLPPYERQLEDMAKHPPLLWPRAELLATAHVLGWSPSLQVDLGKVLLVDVLSALQTWLAEDNLTWITLTPPPRPDKR